MRESDHIARAAGLATVDRRSVELAITLANRTGAELLIGFPSARIDGAVELNARFGGLLPRAPHPVQLIAFADAAIDAVLNVARRSRIARIVLDAESPLFGIDAFEHLSAAFHGDLIVVR